MFLQNTKYLKSHFRINNIYYNKELIFNVVEVILLFFVKQLGI